MIVLIVFFCVLCLLAVSFLALIYFWYYRPLYSRPYPGELIDVISAVVNVRLVELERIVSEEMSTRIAETLSPREQRLARRGRRQAISDRLAPVEANASLCVAFTRPQVRRLRKKRQGPKACRRRSQSERDRLLEELFELAQNCCLLLSFAKVVRVLMPWDRERMIRFHRETVLPEVRNFLRVFVQYAGTFGEVERDNLLAWLDCWELDEGYC
jgi:hypothetical protein